MGALPAIQLFWAFFCSPLNENQETGCSLSRARCHFKKGKPIVQKRLGAHPFFLCHLDLPLGTQPEGQWFPPPLAEKGSQSEPHSGSRAAGAVQQLGQDQDTGVREVVPSWKEVQPRDLMGWEISSNGNRSRPSRKQASQPQRMPTLYGPCQHHLSWAPEVYSATVMLQQLVVAALLHLCSSLKHSPPPAFSSTDFY